MNADASQPYTPPDYVAALDLDCDPFQDRHEARFFYADPALMQRLDLLQHLTRFSEQLLYVRAPAGAGKTMLRQQLQLRAAEHWRLCQLDGAAVNTAAELYVQLSHCYPDAAAENTEHFGSDLIHYCLGLQQVGQLAVLVIDNAERLPAPVLEALLGLARSPAETLKALRILIFATPELDPTLQSLSLKSPGESLVHTLDLPPFDEQQSAAYLMYQLAIAGYSGDSPFSATEVRAMHKTAGGRPGELNRLAHETLLEQGLQRAAARRPAGPSRSRRGRWLTGFALLAVAGIAIGLWQLDTRAPALPGLEEQTLQLPPANPLAAGTDTPAPGPDPATPSPPDTESVSEPADPAQAPAAGETPALEAELSPAVPAPSVGETPAEAPAAPAPEAAEPEPPAPREQATAPAPEPPAAQAAPAQTQTEAAPAAAARTRASTDTDSTPAPDWLADQPADHYTLQLLGARDPETVERFLARHGDEAKLHAIHTWRKAAAWHIVVTGSYPDRAAATAARGALPAALRQLQPWPRRFDQIRAELPPAE
ncbi:hypothetical protein TspCOW1_26360 [Thiohalobacter sp. COW1]|uniref:AAA family ATPase n=1 Tax=Thiohalobacter sp. COW1 TaxID=2795687 RepID=UPI0019156A97|nr:AAA family ATPase [Thiohalobacter sp. COW1]BCO32533.1 hypothetical protein TspCOW1_26360 [Thiohalobacter sp. COW1]